MTNGHTIFAVDDVESARSVLEASFGKDFAFEAFDSAEACLARLDTCTPDLFLLDVELPGIDGYELCRRIRARPALAETPVIFISAHDDLESRLQGYDAGGIDFIVKPFRMAELKHKVELAIASSASRSGLLAQMNESETLTSLILSNLDEYALLIRFLRALNTCPEPRDVADALFAMLASFKLDCALQLRLRDTELTLGAQGDNRPLEVSVMQHVKTLGTIFEFKDRAVINYPAVTVLVNNMPVHDPDLCGRLRDHLAIAVESADAKLESLQIRADRMRTTDEIGDLLTSVRDTVGAFSRKYDSARYEGTALTQATLDELTQAYAHLGMSLEQEERIQGIVQAGSLKLVDLYDFGDETQATLERLAERLRQLLNG